MMTTQTRKLFAATAAALLLSAMPLAAWAQEAGQGVSGAGTGPGIETTTAGGASTEVAGAQAPGNPGVSGASAPGVVGQPGTTQVGGAQVPGATGANVPSRTEVGGVQAPAVVLPRAGNPEAVTGNPMNPLAAFAAAGLLGVVLAARRLRTVRF